MILDSLEDMNKYIHLDCDTWIFPGQILDLDRDEVRA